MTESVFSDTIEFILRGVHGEIPDFSVKGVALWTPLHG